MTGLEDRGTRLRPGAGRGARFRPVVRDGHSLAMTWRVRSLDEGAELVESFVRGVDVRNGVPEWTARTDVVPADVAPWNPPRDDYLVSVQVTVR